MLISLQKFIQLLILPYTAASMMRFSSSILSKFWNHVIDFYSTTSSDHNDTKRHCGNQCNPTSSDNPVVWFHKIFLIKDLLCQNKNYLLRVGICSPLLGFGFIHNMTILSCLTCTGYRELPYAYSLCIKYFLEQGAIQQIK